MFKAKNGHTPPCAPRLRMEYHTRQSKSSAAGQAILKQQNKDLDAELHIDRGGSRLVRVVAEQEVLRIASALPIRSSCPLNWNGIEVHRYRVRRHQTPEYSLPQLAIFIPHLSKPAKGEVYVAGERRTAWIKNGSISIAPPGLPIRTRSDAEPHDTTVIFLDPLVVAEVSAEASCSFLEIEPQYAIRDPLIHEIGVALDAEIASPTPSPRIYAESLGVSLAAHILSRYAKASVQPESTKLRNAQLRRSIEFMNDNLHQNLSLAQIAYAVNMSKYHFAKSFQRAMGIAPHRYFVELRIAKAKELIAAGKLSIQEISYRVGFMDRSHFTTQFARAVGMTPGRYRRELGCSK